MVNTMPSKSPAIQERVADRLAVIGKQIRERRRALRTNLATVAEAAGMSRVTLHRIEKGEPSVTMGAYLNVMDALKMDFGIVKPVEEASHEGWIPARIHLSEYPQLRQLAWQVHGTEELTPSEALGIYERNWRHIDIQSLEKNERDLMEALRTGLGGRV